MQARMLEGCQPKRVGHSRLPRQEGRSRILARSIAACCNEQTAMGTHRKERWRFLPSHKWRRVPTPRFYGGVGAPVGLTVFKTAEGSLGAVPGGFDSHTPLLFGYLNSMCAVINTMVLQNLQDCASYFRLQNYASQQIFKNSRYLSGHRNF